MCWLRLSLALSCLSLGLPTRAAVRLLPALHLQAAGVLQSTCLCVDTMLKQGIAHMCAAVHMRSLVCCMRKLFADGAIARVRAAGS